MAALQGLKVLDLSRFIAGPHCAMLLADFGADVVKVERANGGDDTRSIPPFADGESLYFTVFNRNKRSLRLNFRSAEGQALLRRLAAEADVLIENFRPGTMEAMGCGWEALRALNPRLVMARISGYGQEGPRAAEPCFDVIAQAASGLMEITGDPDGPPTMSGTYVVDYTTALYAAFGIMAALNERLASGRGQLVDVSLLGSATSLLMTAIAEQALFGTTMTRRGNRDRYAAPSGTFLSLDKRWVHVIGGNSNHFPRLARMLQRPDLVSDPRFATADSRMANHAELERILADWCADRSASTILTETKAAEIPAAEVATSASVVDDPQLRAAAYVVDVPHPRAGTIPMQGFPVRLDASPAAVRGSAPAFGAHSAEVLAEWLHLDAGEIEELQRRGTV